MNEPTVAALGGATPSAIIRRYFLATRPKFFTASILPVLLGTAWGAGTVGQLDWIAALLAILATMVVHAGSNVINDVADDLNGTDRNNQGLIHPFTGGSRFIQNGVLTVEQMRRWGITLFVLAMLIGALLILHKGIGVLYFGLAGVALGTLYSLPAVQLSGRGVGEIAVAVAFGVLPVCGAAWLQSGEVTSSIVLISIPISCWVAGILLINEVPDRFADDQAGKRTWPVRFGRRGTRWLYVTLHIIALVAAVTLVLQQVYPWWSLLAPLLLFAGGLRAAATIIADKKEALESGIKMTLAIHATGSLYWILLVLAA